MNVELIPTTFDCKGGSCPKAFRTDRGTLLIQGYRVNREDVSGLGAVAADEDLVEIPAELLAGLPHKASN